MKWLISVGFLMALGVIVMMTVLDRDAAAVQVRMADLQRRLEALEELPVTSTWISGSTTHTVTTQQQDGETPAQWAARHAELLAAMQKQFPPNQ